MSGLTVGITCHECKATIVEAVKMPNMCEQRHVAKKHGYKMETVGNTRKWVCPACLERRK